MMVIDLILRTAFTIVIVAFVARFLAQIGRADFYNPLAQTVVSITDPILKHLRRFIPSIGGLDTASLICILLLQALLATIMLLLSGAGLAEHMTSLIVWSVLSVAAIIITVLQFSMFIVAIASFILMGQYNPFVAFIGQIIEPFVGPFRRLNLQVGMLDLSFIIAIIVLVILKETILLQMIGGAVGATFSPRVFIGI